MFRFLLLSFLFVSISLDATPVESINIELSSGASHYLAIEKELESKPETAGKKVLEEFLRKNGTFHSIRPFSPDYQNEKITILPGDAVYPACTGGFCRSQTFWAVLRPYEKQIVLFPPHATRYGFDPYNGKVNWHRNDAKEGGKDEFFECFQFSKSARYGYQQFDSYRDMTQDTASQEVLDEISAYYSQNYYGPQSSWQGKSGSRRVYVAFAANAHAILMRLVQSNADLSNVVVYYIESEDYISHPMPEWQTDRRSSTAYCIYAEIMDKILDTSKLDTERLSKNL